MILPFWHGTYVAYKGNIHSLFVVVIISNVVSNWRELCHLTCSSAMGYYSLVGDAAAIGKCRSCVCLWSWFCKWCSCCHLPLNCFTFLLIIVGTVFAWWLLHWVGWRWCHTTMMMLSINWRWRWWFHEKMMVSCKIDDDDVMLCDENDNHDVQQNDTVQQWNWWWYPAMRSMPWDDNNENAVQQ